jgi:hypothetical protein
VNPIVALAYVERGLILRPFALNVAFACITVFRPGMPLSPSARELLRCMRLQLVEEMGRISLALGQPSLVVAPLEGGPISGSYHASSPRH